MTAIFSAVVAKSEPRLLHERNGERGGQPIGTTVIASATSVIRCCLKGFQRTEERHITEASQNAHNDGVF